MMTTRIRVNVIGSRVHEQRRKEAEEAAAQEAEEAKADSGSSRGKSKPKKLPKALPKNEEVQGNSTTAADDVLKRFFKRR